MHGVTPAKRGDFCPPNQTHTTILRRHFCFFPPRRCVVVCDPHDVEVRCHCGVDQLCGCVGAVGVEGVCVRIK